MRSILLLTALVFSANALVPAAGNAALDSGAKAAFEVFPPEVNLKYQRDRQGLVVRVTEPTGVHRDVTKEATFTVADPAKAKVENGIVAPVADGETKVQIQWNGRSADVPVKVEAATVDPEISFRVDVMP
ncbi:MAG: cell surface protein, partial [Verrucomicrobiaceae bacterium]